MYPAIMFTHTFTSFRTNKQINIIKKALVAFSINKLWNKTKIEQETFSY